MNASNIKLFCSDIDGTLLDANRWLSENTVSAFAKANLPIILASSRPPQAMRYLQEGLGITGEPLIAYNGALVIGKNAELLEDLSFSTKVLRTLLEHHSKNNYNLSIYSHEYWFTDREDSWTLREINNTRVSPRYLPANESLAFLEQNTLGIHKLMCMGTPKELESLIAFLSPTYSDIVHLYRSKATYLEITPKNTDKAKALKKLLDTHYNFGMEEVMAFGDNHNDVQLIRKTGYGVAVQNATIELKSIAKYVSPYTNKQDAVAKTIEAHF